MGYKGRDIEVSEVDHGQLLVAACDSCGGIGEKSLDKIRVPAELVGRLTTRVAVMELIAVGAAPKLLTVSISAEPEPTGTTILAGVKAELKAAGLAHLPCVISTEKNIPTSQTGLGIGVTGTCLKEALKTGCSQAGDTVYCLGYPKVGKELNSADDPEIVQLDAMIHLANHPAIHDIVPIGSSGILLEIARFADQVSCCFVEGHHSLNANKSAGPSSCAVFTCLGDFQDKLPGSAPLTKIGCLISS